jgi:cell division transport system permease protein
MSSTYVLRETAGNLVRNIVMTVAAVLTMAVSLTALGGVLIMRQAINKATVQWQGGVQLAVFMNANASNQEIKAIGDELHAMVPQEIQKYWWVDKEKAYAEFKQMFAGEPAFIKVMSVSQMPPSYRVVPARAQNVAQLASQFDNQPGVHNVGYPQQAINQMLSHFSTLRTVALVLAAGVMVGAIALIINTIQLAIFSRRREVAVMKLVGATNWFIRVPFMLEGLAHGLAGACAAFILTYFSRGTIASFVGSDSLNFGAPLYVSPHEAVFTGVFILIIGMLVGMLGSAFAVRRFLVV